MNTASDDDTILTIDTMSNLGLESWLSEPVWLVCLFARGWSVVAAGLAARADESHSRSGVNSADRRNEAGLDHLRFARRRRSS